MAFAAQNLETIEVLKEKHGKRYAKAVETLRSKVTQALPFDAAIENLLSVPKAKFDEAIDVAIRLGVDPKQSDQNVRGAVVLPSGTGKTVRVAVFAKGPKAKEAEDAGADVVGAEELAEKINGGWMEFDSVVATPDMMAVVSKVARVLGPRGLMPNPKVGTVSMDLTKVVGELKKGRVEFRANKEGIVQTAIGRFSFGKEKLAGNFSALIEAIVRAKPSSSKGNYFLSVYVSSTMGPSVLIDHSLFMSEKI